MQGSLSIIIPVYNEEEAIGPTVAELLPVARKHGWSMIIVNDGSTDGTAGELEPFEDRCRIIHHPYNRGYGASL